MTSISRDPIPRAYCFAAAAFFAVVLALEAVVFLGAALVAFLAAGFALVAFLAGDVAFALVAFFLGAAFGFLASEVAFFLGAVVFLAVAG